mmetsp:Transcript_5787/g.8458  ORF Transcript_5787/g.8458 Transcript_5787/m.8458 type:complete len:542 (+) Transcript_5787:407-2032(+)|eukprot:CAMPEP_0196815306 /NCGR_PEP_ID=MMETSP1362-20130617/48943_1 /TAXON_ID=163516 /ORGANISM="Leptocylindrus danicus, Strain CCMP1856" /LENGTH=541 /DNA_ID=CAMNT_0042192215 /DNA_START=207 /DNA_END=1832 /DNA_ORIENTATION=-
MPKWSPLALATVLYTAHAFSTFTPASTVTTSRNRSRFLYNTSTRRQIQLQASSAGASEKNENKQDNNSNQDTNPSQQQQQQQQQSSSPNANSSAGNNLSEAQADMDRLMKSDNPPFNPRYEVQQFLQSAKSSGNEIISTAMSPDSLEYEQEQTFMALESAMNKAAAEKKWDLAAAKRDEIDRMHIDDCGFVLSVNSAFYRAFTEKDADAMSQLWMECETVQCIHPSLAPQIGYKQVMASWKTMFDSQDKTFQSNVMEPSSIKLSLKGATAWLTCDEEVYTSKFVSGVGKTKELVKKFRATNIFRKVDGSWRMVHHHATWIHENDSITGSAGSKSARGKKGKFSGNNAVEISGLEGLAGLTGGSVGKDGPVKRVFMGSLSDLLSGNLDDIMSGSSNSADDAIVESAFIQIGNDDDDEDDDEDDVSDERIRKHWRKMGGAGDGGSAIHSSSKNGVPKDALRQNCITALRRLCNQGAISQKQKRVLLTDIITCSARGEFSMVEVAYELLCGEGDDKDAAEEEFADQCRVFANDLGFTPPNAISS